MELLSLASGAIYVFAGAVQPMSLLARWRPAQAQSETDAHFVNRAGQTNERHRSWWAVSCQNHQSGHAVGRRTQSSDLFAKVLNGGADFSLMTAETQKAAPSSNCLKLSS